MCGVVGIFGRNLTEDDLAKVVRSTDLLKHRGPDASGTARFHFDWTDVILGATRLKIVDHCNLTVPHVFSSVDIALAFNGEIYNWRDLRDELSDGTPWETECDSEVVARAWRKWGHACLDRLNGMFAFALVDLSAETCFLVRDRVGEKPLYWTEDDAGQIRFASEIKAIGLPLRESYCPELEYLEFDCLASTPLQTAAGDSIYTLEPGHFLEYCKSNGLTKHLWWTLPKPIPGNTPDMDELTGLVIDAVRIRANPAVPVAVLLSGGLDSAIIQAIVKKERLYCCTFPQDDVDNMRAARLASQKHRVKPVTFDYADLKRDLEKIAYHLDTPATWTAVCQWFLFEKVAEDGSVVVLTGEGADELFAGYARYRLLWHTQQAADDVLLADYAPMRDYLYGSSYEILGKMLDRSKSGAYLDVAIRIAEKYGIDDYCFYPQRVDNLVDAACRLDFQTTMQVLLRMADRMSAAFSLENRAPFLDYRIMEYAAKLPAACKVTARESKAPLREVARRLGVSPKIIAERTKRGLFLPWARWTDARGAEGRGAWDRASFARAMRAAWRRAFGLAPASSR